MIGVTSAAETIKVLILNETYPKLPAKNEHLEKIGAMEGDLLVMGTKYTGNITVWKSDAGLYVVNEIPLEEYVKDVVAVEVSPDWDKEALKAQAVVTRTYAVYQKMTNGNAIYDIASSVLHQVYKGNNPDARVSSAVEETKDEVLTFDGKPIASFYHSTCGGKTENPEEVFGKSYPFLHSVETGCTLSPYALWERSIPAAEIEKALNINGNKKDHDKVFHLDEPCKTARHRALLGNSDRQCNRPQKSPWLEPLPSTNFAISGDGDPFVFEGKGIRPRGRPLPVEHAPDGA